MLKIHGRAEEQQGRGAAAPLLKLVPRTDRGNESQREGRGRNDKEDKVSLREMVLQPDANPQPSLKDRLPNPLPRRPDDISIAAAPSAPRSLLARLGPSNGQRCPLMFCDQSDLDVQTRHGKRLRMGANGPGHRPWLSVWDLQRRHPKSGAAQEGTRNAKGCTSRVAGGALRGSCMPCR